MNEKREIRPFMPYVLCHYRMAPTNHAQDSVGRLCTTGQAAIVKTKTIFSSACYRKTRFLGAMT